MDFSADERRRAFSAWLRTGRLPRPLRVDGIVLKFNPWHDPRTGRFTFAGTGRYFGRWGGGGFTGGGGGTFRGGGATGTDPWPDPRTKLEAPQPKRPTPSERAVPAMPAHGLARQQLSPSRRGASSAPEFRRLVRNGYEYQIDFNQRTRRVSGVIIMSAPQPRSRTAQARAGGADRRPSDDGGHYIARRFNGPIEAFNHFAQDANFNRGGYRALEDQWARATTNGKKVEVKIIPVYVGRSRRPSAINVWFVIDGKRESLHFPNERKESGRGK